jgi:2'-5' RNA ligase
VRLFFAALPPPEVRWQLETVAGALNLPKYAAPVPVENYHLTLAFAGDVANTRAAALRSIGAALRGASFETHFDICEHWAKSEVIVVAASACNDREESLATSGVSSSVHDILEGDFISAHVLV